VRHRRGRDQRRRARGGLRGDYFAALVDIPPLPVALVFLLAVALLNARGIHESMRANMVMTLVESAGLVFIVLLGALIVARGDADPGRFTEIPGEGAGGVAAAVVAAAGLAFYSFVGFETSANLAEETVDPRRTYPRALIGGILLAGVLYVAVGLVVTLTVPRETLVGSTGPLLEVVRVADVGVPAALFSVVALGAVANGALLTGIYASRLTYGMAKDGLLPPVFTRVLSGRRTPWVAIVATIALSMVLATTGGLAELASTIVLMLLVTFASTNLAVIVLRRRPEEGEPDHVRVPLVLPVLGLLSCFGLATQQEAGVWLRGAILLVVGLVLYAIARATRRARMSTDR
jgi:amino acid transporter